MDLLRFSGFRPAEPESGDSLAGCVHFGWNQFLFNPPTQHSCDSADLLIDAVPDHAPGLLRLRVAEGRVIEMLNFGLPGKAFLHDQETQFIAQVQKTLILGIMRAAHKIAAQVFQNLQIMQELRGRQGRTELGMDFMTVIAQQFLRLAVDQNIAVFD